MNDEEVSASTLPFIIHHSLFIIILRGHELLRRTLIQRVLPFCFCVVPLLAALLIAVATPKKALGFYLEHVRDSRIDWIILTLGVVLFAIQLMLSWRALQWRATGFDEQYDRWLSHLAQAAEWFPMLGLIGTVAGLLDTLRQKVGSQ